MCNELNFDELAELFRQDPIAFDKYKQAHIDKAIAEMCGDCPEKLKRCQQFQWRLEQELAKHKNPIMRYNAMVEIFWKGVEEFQHATKYGGTKPKPKSNATILDFNKKE